MVSITNLLMTMYSIDYTVLLLIIWKVNIISLILSGW